MKCHFDHCQAVRSGHPQQIHAVATIGIGLKNLLRGKVALGAIRRYFEGEKASWIL
jgi:hypothetical protein